MTFAFLSACVEGGYYPQPSLPQIPQYDRLVKHNAYVPQALHTETYAEYSIPEESVSYSLSYNDYNYLKQYQNGQQNHVSSDLHSTLAKKLPCHRYHLSYNNLVGEGIHLDHVTDTHDNIDNFVNTQSLVDVPTVEPVIKKHIYFHMPPPDLEERRPVIHPKHPPKKTYNILFIKVPSQDSIYANNIQELLRNRFATEEKTLIYVLVKKPEEQTVLLPNPVKTSEHEVFYVKYKGEPDNVASEINDGLDLDVDSGETTLLNPGLANGHFQE